MSQSLPTRRDALLSALGAGAFFLLPEVAQASDSATGPATAFSFDLLKNKARAMARQPFVPAAIPEAEMLERIDYDHHNQIRFRKDQALWAGRPDTSPVQFFFPGRYFKDPVRVYAVDQGMSREIPFSTGLFDIPEGNPAQGLTATEGFAGFRVQDAETGNDWMSFLGASYWRTEGYSGQFGLSVRGLALDTAVAGQPEEFPRFTRFWLEPQAGGGLITCALLESPRATGAYRITSHRDNGVIQEVEAAIFLRGDVGRLGLAPLTSMFWYGKHNRHIAPDWRPEVHDSDGLEVHDATGTRIWRPLNNPPRTMANSFLASRLGGFGLMQRERRFEEYLDDGVFYEKRASAWVEPLGDWGAGSVGLVEISTDDEIHDNIVAFWTPEAPAKAGSEYNLAYRLSWVENCPVPPVAARFTATRIGAGGNPGQPRPELVAKIVCDFDGFGFDGLTSRDPFAVRITASRGTVGEGHTYPVVGEDYWRLVFDLDISRLPAEDDAPVDLHLFVELQGRVMTETLLLQLFPSQLRRLLKSRA